MEKTTSTTLISLIKNFVAKFDGEFFTSKDIWTVTTILKKKDELPHLDYKAMEYVPLKVGENIVETIMDTGVVLSFDDGDVENCMVMPYEALSEDVLMEIYAWLLFVSVS